MGRSIFLMTSCSSLQNISANVYGIRYSEFVSDVYPNIDKPVVVLFVSNYCVHSKRQLNLLKKEINKNGYDEYIDFYVANVDIDENLEWLIDLCDEKGYSSPGTPTWVFYQKRMNGEKRVTFAPGNMTADMLEDDFSRLINFYKKPNPYY